MEYLFFVAYLVLFAWLVTRIRFFQLPGFSRAQLVILFLIKVIAGIFYGWMGIYYGNLAQMVDTWSFHQFGLVEYRILLDHPGEYFSNLFFNPYDGWGKLFASSDSYWNDLKGNLFVKMLSIFDVFTLGHYYVNVIFYSFLTLFGPMAIYRVMIDLFPKQRIAVLAASFFLPSFIYWTSGIHKEGLIFLAISFIIYHLYFGWKERRFTLRRWIGIAGCLVLLFILRNFLMLLIVPAILAFWLATRRPRYAFAIFSGVYLLFGSLFFLARYIDPRLDFPQAVVNKQQDFLRLQGGASTIPIKELEPSFQSFVRNTPQAITLSFLRPYPGDVTHLLSMAASLEIFVLLLLVVLFILFRKKNGVAGIPVYLCIFLAFSTLLATGFSINNLGAIVRYRSIVMPLMIIPVVGQTDWSRIVRTLLGKNKNDNPS